MRHAPTSLVTLARGRYAQAMLVVRGLAKSIASSPPRVLFTGVDLQLDAGEYVAIMGESGTGKSTLLNLLAGLDTADAGSVAIDGAVLASLDDDAITLLRRKTVGFVFQAFHVLPYLSVGQNVALPLSLLGTNADVAGERTTDMLLAVGLGGRRDSMPRELSGGELQRVAIARALVHRPSLVLADEPTGNLDPQSASQVLHLLRDQIKTSNASGVLVTHSRVAAKTCDRVLQLTAAGLLPFEPQ
jgi:putative ABC transport system ATP-binding protein